MDQATKSLSIHPNVPVRVDAAVKRKNELLRLGVVILNIAEPTSLRELSSKYPSDLERYVTAHPCKHTA